MQNELITIERERKPDMSIQSLVFKLKQKVKTAGHGKVEVNGKKR